MAELDDERRAQIVTAHRSAPLYDDITALRHEADAERERIIANATRRPWPRWRIALWTFVLALIAVTIGGLIARSL